MSNDQDDRLDLASELIYQRVREKVNVCAIAVFASDLARVQVALGKDPTGVADMIVNAWGRVTGDLEAMIMEMRYGAMEAEADND